MRLHESYSSHKEETYRLLKEQIKALTEGEPHVIPNLANASALLNASLPDINWVGFYLKTDGYLLLGPFQGKPACIRIPIGQGVCGSSVKENRSQLVADVHQFPGHIACDSESNSELVIPLRHGKKIVGVLDIDSPIINRFDEEDLTGLESFVSVLETACHW